MTLLSDTIPALRSNRYWREDNGAFTLYEVRPTIWSSEIRKALDTRSLLAIYRSGGQAWIAISFQRDRTEDRWSIKLESIDPPLGAAEALYDAAK
jgi:hypothetical protein